jgi:type I restriction enzyme M protein
MLKVGGRCGVVIKNTFLSNTDNASIALRKQLLEECDLQAVLELPQGSFTGTGVKTVVLFFEKGRTTDKVWYYQLNLSRNLGKTNSLNERDLEEFVKLFKTQGDSENSWSVSVNDIDKSTWDLTATNPNRKEEVDNRTPQEILAEIKSLDEDVAEALKAIEELL